MGAGRMDSLYLSLSLEDGQKFSASSRERGQSMCVKGVRSMAVGMTDMLSDRLTAWVAESTV